MLFLLNIILKLFSFLNIGCLKFLKIVVSRNVAMTNLDKKLYVFYISDGALKIVYDKTCRFSYKILDLNG